jgi:CelD/BcsL family acetyltransferase involved in cellulose biosynthesis
MQIELTHPLSIRHIDADVIPALLRSHPELGSDMVYPNFFGSAGWFDAVIRSGQPHQPFGLAVYRGHQPVALLPLEVTRNPLGGSDFRYLGYRFHPDPIGLICHKDDLPAAAAALTAHLSELRQWDRLILDYILPEEAIHWPGTSRGQSIAPYFPLPPTFDALLAGFNGKKRYKLRAKLRRAEDSGLAMSIAESTAEKARYLDELFRLHEQRSEHVGRDSSLQRPEVERLHQDLVTTCPEAILFGLRSGDRLVAVLYGFLSHKRFSFFQITHDPAFDELRPGTVILAKAIAHLCEAGALEFNFLQGEESYKFEWSTDTRQLIQVRLASRRIRGRLLDHLERMKGNIRTTIRRMW